MIRRSALRVAIFAALGCHACMMQAQGVDEEAVNSCGNTSGQIYIPVDSWVYPAVLRLYSLGFLDHVYLGMRPWTRDGLRHMLEQTQEKIEDADGKAIADEAESIYTKVMYELNRDQNAACLGNAGWAQVESTYTAARGLSGTPLRDSFHLGSTLVNDFGRPYEHGGNNFTGASGYVVAGRFSIYLRGEFQGAPSAAGYSSSLYQLLAYSVDGTVSPVTGSAYAGQVTIPGGPIGTAEQGRFLEVYAAGRVWNHVFSLGKQDEWLGPAQGASFAYSNNAENLYGFHISRTEPLYIPLLSRFTGPFRYEFMVGPLRGHTLMRNPLYNGNSAVQPNVISPGNPWGHVEKLSFRPTDNLELGFSRTAIFGGEGHSPVTLHTFLRSFFSASAPQPAKKGSSDDPGARFGTFDFSYRLPYLRDWLTLYADGEVHDDISPIDAPRRASWRPGLYLSHLPGLPKLDVRAEAAWTDPPITNSQGGKFMYWETIEKQGYTNQGQIFGDWIGREDKGGQGWITYHLSGNEWIQASWRNQKAAKDFIPGGTTLNDFGVQVVKRIGKDVEIDGNFAWERWKAPVYKSGLQTVTSTTIQITWFPGQKFHF